MGAAWFALLALADAASAAPPPDVVVTTTAAVNSERLADALRTYLGDYGVRVGVVDAEAAPGGDLRHQLGEARRLGEAVRAIAVVRAEAATSGMIEIEVVDLATEKALVASVPRPARDEDLYRALALKIQALLRSTLSEAPERLAPDSGPARLAESNAPALTARAAPTAPRLSLDTGYTAVSFPLAGTVLHGLSVRGAFSPRPWLELGLGVAGLGAERLHQGDVVAVVSIIPISAAARLRAERARFELLAGPSATLALASVGTSTSSTTTFVHDSRELIAGLGAEGEGRVRLGSTAWAYLRASALGVLVGTRYRVQGQAVLDTSRLEVAATAGIGIGVR
jgi:hypothetical protein